MAPCASDIKMKEFFLFYKRNSFQSTQFIVFLIFFTLNGSCGGLCDICHNAHKVCNHFDMLNEKYFHVMMCRVGCRWTTIICLRVPVEY